MKATAIAFGVAIICAEASRAAPPDDMVFADGLNLLTDVRDNEFSFDDPAFYWFCRWVNGDKDSARYDIAESKPVSWRHLIERPSDFRGQLVTVEGTLLRLESYDVANRPGVERLHQCELAAAGTRAILTAVLTEDPGEPALRSMVQVRGYFIKVRAFATASGGSGAGPLIVGKGLEVVTGSGSVGAATPSWGFDTRTFLVVGTVVLAALWFVLRRTLNRESPAAVPLPKNSEASPDDFDWLTEPGQDERRS